MKNGFIMEKSWEKYDNVLPRTVGGIFLTAIVCLPFALLTLPTGDYSFAAIWGVLTALILAGGMIERHKSKKILDRITDIARHMGKQGYYRACDDLSGGKRFGVLYCGREWLFSPYGTLRKWQDIEGVSVKLYYGGYREVSPFKSAEITLSLSDGSSEMFTALGREELMELNNSFDDFAAFAGELGVRAERCFE